MDAWWCHRRGQVAPMRQWDWGEETPIYKKGEGRRKETKRIRWRPRAKSRRKEKGLLAGRYGGHGRISEILGGETSLSSPPPLDVIYSGTATLSEGDGARERWRNTHLFLGVTAVVLRCRPCYGVEGRRSSTVEKEVLGDWGIKSTDNTKKNQTFSDQHINIWKKYLSSTSREGVWWGMPFLRMLMALSRAVRRMLSPLVCRCLHYSLLSLLTIDFGEISPITE